MANYNNLSTLAGLAVGDVVTYNTATTIDFKKYKVRITLNGIGYDSNHGGGLTQFDLDTKNLPSQILTYSPLGGTSLCYGSSYDKYYRIGVAGNYGGGSISYVRSYSGKGGGTTGGSGSTETDYGKAYGGSGGTQTAGGSGGTWSRNGYGTAVVSSGSDGVIGSFEKNSSADQSDYYCAGWYAGGTGGQFTKGSTYGGQTRYGGNGGGSGFVIGQSTTTYPSGYLGNDITLQSTITSAISNATLTQGGSTNYNTGSTNLPTTATMEITILELPPVTGPKYYNGSSWVQTTVKRYNGSSWEDVVMKYYDGSSWQ